MTNLLLYHDVIFVIWIKNRRRGTPHHHHR